MPAPVYSVRFIATGGIGWSYFYVPTGHRAVIRCITSLVWGVRPSWQTVSVAGAAIWSDTNQEAESTRLLDVRHVAYSGEQVGCYSSDSDTNFFISGYLFADAAGAGELQDVQVYDPPTPRPPEAIYDAQLGSVRV